MKYQRIRIREREGGGGGGWKEGRQGGREKGESESKREYRIKFWDVKESLRVEH